MVHNSSCHCINKVSIKGLYNRPIKNMVLFWLGLGGSRPWGGGGQGRPFYPCIEICIFLSVAYLLDVGRVNAKTVAHLQKRDSVPDSRHFGFDLVRGLVTPHLKRRMNQKGIQKFIQLSQTLYLGKPWITVLYGVVGEGCAWTGQRQFLFGWLAQFRYLTTRVVDPDLDPDPKRIGYFSGSGLVIWLWIRIPDPDHFFS